MTELLIATVLSAALAGMLGYTVAVVKRDTAIALLQRELSAVLLRLDKADSMMIGQNDRTDRHLRIIQRIMLDIARKSGVDIRVADILEITSLEPEERS